MFDADFLDVETGDAGPHRDRRETRFSNVQPMSTTTVRALPGRRTTPWTRTWIASRLEGSRR
jgi:hypothetical protein